MENWSQAELKWRPLPIQKHKNTVHNKNLFLLLYFKKTLLLYFRCMVKPPVGRIITSLGGAKIPPEEELDMFAEFFMYP